MTASTLVRAAARRELDLARASIDFVDRLVLSRLGSRAEPARDVLTRLRDTVGDLAERTSPGESGTTAAAPRAQQRPAGTGRGRARESAPPAEAASAVLTADEVEEATELADTYLAEEEGHLVGELAEDDELRRVQAELRAKHALQERDEQHPTS